MDGTPRGLGNTLQDTRAGGSSVRYSVGMWGSDMQTASSKFQKLRNCVDTLEDERKGRGSSKNKALHEEVLRMCKLDVCQACVIHLIYCAGTRMIAQGTDGLSQGSLNEEVMRATEAYPGIQDWVRSWAPGEVEILDAEEWFKQGHGIELRQARHKRQISSHIILIPKLLTPYWRQQLLKAADIIIEIPAVQ
eukprot:2479580-Ditylum_brightwellii.AAC.1